MKTILNYILTGLALFFCNILNQSGITNEAKAQFLLNL